jgi:cytoskeletal protein CcmA (bactofilin family)
VSSVTTGGPDSDENGTQKTTRASGEASDSSVSEVRDDRGTSPQLQGGMSVATIGKSIHIKGDVNGEEDLEIDGEVEGQITLAGNQLTIGAHGQVKGELNAKSIVVVGQVSGNLIATERAEIQGSGSVEGDIKAPRLLVQEGAVVNGSIEMGKAAAAATSPGDRATGGQKPPAPQRPLRQEAGQQPMAASSTKT